MDGMRGGGGGLSIFCTSGGCVLHFIKLPLFCACWLRERSGSLFMFTFLGYPQHVTTLQRR